MATLSGRALQSSLQRRFQRREALVLCLEGQVVDINNELLGVVGNRPDQLGELVQGVLCNLDQAEVVELGDVHQALDRGRFAGAAVAVQKHVVGGLAGEHHPGVFNDRIPLELIADHVLLVDGVGMLHLGKLPLLPMERTAQGESSAAVFPVAFEDILLVKALAHGQLRQILNDGGKLLPQLGAGRADVPLESRAGQHGYAGQPPNVHGRRVLHIVRRRPRRNGVSDEALVILKMPSNALRQSGKACVPDAVNKLRVALDQPVGGFRPGSDATAPAPARFPKYFYKRKGS